MYTVYEITMLSLWNTRIHFLSMVAEDRGENITHTMKKCSSDGHQHSQEVIGMNFNCASMAL